MAASEVGLKVLQEFITAAGKTRQFGSWFSKAKVISGGNGKCVYEMTIDEEHMNEMNTLHGGCVASLVDITTSLALHTLPHIPSAVTVDLNVSILRPGKKGEDIIIDAKTTKAGRSLAFSTVEIKRKIDGVLIATGSHTQFVGQRFSKE